MSEHVEMPIFIERLFSLTSQPLSRLLKLRSSRVEAGRRAKRYEITGTTLSFTRQREPVYRHIIPDTSTFVNKLLEIFHVQPSKMYHTNSPPYDAVGILDKVENPLQLKTQYFTLKGNIKGIIM